MDGHRPLPDEIAAPARRALEGAGITDLDALREWTEDELLALHGMGPNAMRRLREALGAHGLALREG